MKTPLATLAFTVLLCLVLPKPSHGVENSGNDNPTGLTGEYNGSVTTGGSYDPYTGNAKRFIDDLTVTGSVGAYPLKWTRILNTRGVRSSFGTSGGWRNSYQWGLILHPRPPNYSCPDWGPDATVEYPDGAEKYFYLEGDTYVTIERGEPGDRLVHMGGANYDVRLKDGGRVEFRGAVNYIFDPYGQRTTLEYELDSAGYRLRKVTEPAGRYLEISYVQHPAGGTVLDHVTSYDGPAGNAIETVTYHYTAVTVHNSYLGDWLFLNLTSVTYAGDNGPVEAHYTYNLPHYLTPGNYSTLVGGTVHICEDVRFSGAMSSIEYGYEAPDGRLGQVSGEKNLATGEYVSRVEYPSGPSDGWTRVERRPDGAMRKFTYSPDGDAELLSYTDFFFPNDPVNSPPHTTTIALLYPGGPSNPANVGPGLDTVDPESCDRCAP
jgi:hypothetical protein